MPTFMYAVEGMVCESCMAAVLANVHSLSGVTVVAMDLVTGGRSPLIVTSGAKLGVHDLDDYPTARQVPGLIVYRYDSPLFFANAQDFKRRALAALDRAEGPVEWLMLNAEANVEVDLTSVDALDQIRFELERRGIVLALVRVKQDLRDDLASSGFLDRVGQDRVYMTLPTGVAAYIRWYTDAHGHGPVGFVSPAPPPSPWAQEDGSERQDTPSGLAGGGARRKTERTTLSASTPDGQQGGQLFRRARTSLSRSAVDRNIEGYSPYQRWFPALSISTKLCPGKPSCMPLPRVP